MVQLSPDTRLTGWDGCSGYHYSDRRLYGFSHTHLSGTGVADLCDILIMPIAQGNLWDSEAYASPFDKSSEKAEPGYYSVVLDAPGVKAEMTASPRVGLHRYRFPHGADPRLILDLEHRDPVIDARLEIVSPTILRGSRRSRSWAKDQRLFFVMHFSRPVVEMSLPPGQKLEGRKVKAIFRFAPGNEPLMVKTAISAVDCDGARRNMEQELPGWDFDACRRKARTSWNQALAKIEVSGGSPRQMSVFYTALYHCFIHPSLAGDVDGRYRAQDGSIQQAEGYQHYSIFSLWDTFRTLHPLLTIVDRQRSRDFIHTFLSIYRHGGLLPVWELWANETFCMIGYHSVSVILDAWMKGIRDFDVSLAYEAMKHSATRDHFGLDAYKKYGQIAADKDHEGVSKTLEYAYDDWCIGRMAMALGKADEGEIYLKRAQYYKNIFDSETGFMRPRVNGGWKSPFDPSEVDFNFTEANSWQYSFFVPHDISGLIALHGGKSQMERKLDDLFSTKQSLSGRSQSDITGLIGQYAHGNEPSHHMAYLYSFLGKPHKTRQRVHQIMNSLYSAEPDGLCGNEDCGQMSAWLVMSALGIYPVTPGRPEYVINSPWFEKAVINMENGKRFVIEAPKLSETNNTIVAAHLNGRPHPESFISHEALASGGQLIFTMGPESQSDWGTGAGHSPVSQNEAQSIPLTPVISAEAPSFSDYIDVSVMSPDRDSTLYYTCDGSVPDEKATRYSKPFRLKESTLVRALAVSGKGERSPVIDARFNRFNSDYEIDILAQVNRQYTAGGPKGLIDGLRGHENFRLGGWQGYQDQDFEAVIDLRRVKDIGKLTAGFLQDAGSWIMMPKEVEFWLSENGRDYRLAGNVHHSVPDTEMNPVIRDLELKLNARARYVKVIARKYGPLPDWHLGAGHPAFIFIDEIMVTE